MQTMATQAASNSDIKIKPRTQTLIQQENVRLVSNLAKILYFNGVVYPFLK